MWHKSFVISCLSLENDYCGESKNGKLDAAAERATPGMDAELAPSPTVGNLRCMKLGDPIQSNAGHQDLQRSAELDDLAARFTAPLAT